MKKAIVASLALALGSLGCVGLVETSGPYDHDEDSPRVDIAQAYSVDTYLPLTSSVVELIGPRVQGYFSPELYRYCDYLYPADAANSDDNLPCYVEADFNGDGYYDYALLFSAEEWTHDAWFLTTRLLVVLSTRHGDMLSCDIELGTVWAHRSVPVEEFWGISLVPAGDHVFTTYGDGIEKVETFHLENDCFYLASLDEDEEALFYAEGNEMYETEFGATGLAKKQALSKGLNGKRTIPFTKNVEGRARKVQ